MTVEEVEAQHARIRRNAGLLALEYDAQGRTPDGYTVGEHAYAIYIDGIALAEQATAMSAMTFVYAAKMIADSYENQINEMQEAGK